MWESVVVKGKKRSIVADFEDKGALSKRRLAATNARPPLHSFESLICGNKSNSFPLFFFLPESGITGTLVFFSFFFFRFWTSDWLAFHLFSLVATRFVHSSNRQTRGSRRRIFGGKVFKIIRGIATICPPYLPKISRVYSQKENWNAIQYVTVENNRESTMPDSCIRLKLISIRD